MHGEKNSGGTSENDSGVLREKGARGKSGKTNTKCVYEGNKDDDLNRYTCKGCFHLFFFSWRHLLTHEQKKCIFGNYWYPIGRYCR